MADSACWPLVAALLVQPPVAAQEVALVEDQAMVVLPPLAMLDGVAVTVTAGCAPTVTVAAPEPEPPVPLQVMA
jgi:hypothetical protein